MRDSNAKILTVATGLENGQVRVNFKDTGCGIREEDRSQIFEPFSPANPEPSRGLGLTVVKRLLEIVQGESRVESEVGKGTPLHCSFRLLVMKCR